MDLIYTDKHLEDIGILQDYKLDIAYGADENDFELELSLDNHCCKEDNFIYIGGTEYGGIIDTIQPDTANNTVKYIGRTWHGILNSRIISPETGYDYYTVNGPIKDILEELLQVCQLDFLFEVGECEEVEVDDYQFRYTLLYDGICEMLSTVNCKLKMSWENGRIILNALTLVNYALMDEFDSSQLEFAIKKNYNLANHFVCLGTGDLKDRNVIHIFTDKGGGIQPYTVTDNPAQDSDYILDESRKVVNGLDEIVYKYDFSSAQTTENYLKLKEKPADWDNNYTRYFKKNNDSDEDGYTEIEKNIGDIYEKLRGKPVDWDYNFSAYYETDGEGGYVSVSGEEMLYFNKVASLPSDWNSNYERYFIADSTSESGYRNVGQIVKDVYVKVKKEPADWKKKYDNYYTNDGTGKTPDIDNPNTTSNTTYGKGWAAVSGNSKKKYVKLTTEPSEWKKSWKDYYIYSSSAKTYIKAESFYYQYNSMKFVKNKFYKEESKSVAPKFKNQTVYKKTTSYLIPDFSSLNVYEAYNADARQWMDGYFYAKKENVDLGVKFVPGTYFCKVLDHYADLVKNALKVIENLYDSDELNLKVEPTEDIYDVGDLVGAEEHTTGITIVQPIIKKIISINKNLISVNYEVNKD